MSGVVISGEEDEQDAEGDLAFNYRCQMVLLAASVVALWFSIWLFSVLDTLDAVERWINAGACLIALLVTVGVFRHNLRMLFAVWAVLMTAVFLFVDNWVLPAAVAGNPLEPAATPRLVIGFSDEDLLDDWKLLNEFRLTVDRLDSRGFAEGSLLLSGTSGPHSQGALLVATPDLGGPGRFDPARRPRLSIASPAGVRVESMRVRGVTIRGVWVTTRQEVAIVQVPIRPNQFVVANIKVRWPVDVRQNGLGRHVYAVGLSAPPLFRYDKPEGWLATYVSTLPPIRVTVRRSTGVQEFERLAPGPSILAFGEPTWVLSKGRRSLLLDVETRNEAVRRLVDLLSDLLFLGAGFLLGAAGTRGGLSLEADEAPRGTPGWAGRWLPWALAALMIGIVLLLAAAIAIPGNVYDETFVYSDFGSLVFFAVPLLVMTGGITAGAVLLRNEVQGGIAPPANPLLSRWLHDRVYRRLHLWMNLLPGLALVWVVALTVLEVSRDDWPSVSSAAGLGALVFLVAAVAWIDLEANQQN